MKQTSTKMKCVNENEMQREVNGWFH